MSMDLLTGDKCSNGLTNVVMDLLETNVVGVHEACFLGIHAYTQPSLLLYYQEETNLQS